MTITTQSADGVLHQFPDGTNPAVVDKVMKDYAAKNAPPPQSSTLGDIAKSAWGGLLQGAASLGGLPGDVTRLGERATMAVYDLLSPGHGDQIKTANDTFDALQNALPSGIPFLSGTQSGINGLAPVGSKYQPQTTPGQYAHTIGSFAPAAIGGEGALLPRLAGRVVAPAVTSEAAGQLTAGTSAEPYARVAGGLVGGLPSLLSTGARVAAPAIARTVAAQAEPLDPVAAKLVMDYEGMGGNLRPGQYSPANIIRQGDSVAADTPFPGLAGFKPNSQTRISPSAQHDQFNTLISNTFGENAPRITGDVITGAKERIGKVYDTVLDRNTVTADRPLLGKLATIENKVAESAPAMDAAHVTRITAVLNKLRDRLSTQGGFTGRQYQLYRQRNGVLDELANSGSPALETAARDLRDALDDAFARQAPGQDGQALAQANQQYRALRTIEPLANKAPNGNISPKLLMNVVNQEFGHPDNAGNLGILARVGKAFLAEPSNSGTSERTFWRTLQSRPLTAVRHATEAAFSGPYSALVTRNINNAINSPAMRARLLGTTHTPPLLLLRTP